MASLLNSFRVIGATSKSATVVAEAAVVLDGSFGRHPRERVAEVP